MKGMKFIYKSLVILISVIVFMSIGQVISIAYNGQDTTGDQPTPTHNYNTNMSDEQLTRMKDYR